MDRAWLVGWIVLGACSFDATGLGRDPGLTTVEITSSGAGTTTGGPLPTSGTTTTPTGEEPSSSTSVELTITGTSTSTGTSTGTDTSTSTSGTDTGTSGTDTGTSGTDTSTGGTDTGDSTSDGSSSGSSSTGEAPSCLDGLANGAETDVDCGGPDCPACADGALCGEDSDCSSLRCELGQCVAATCEDGVQNGAESDIDCGAAPCPGCAVGEMCGVDEDCVTGICGPGVCVASTCENFKQDGLETNIDCGGDCPACVGPIINEVDYDQALADDGEFVELYNPGPSPIALAGMQLVLVDGADSTPYTTIELGPAGVLAPGGYLVVRAPDLPVAPGALTLDFALKIGNIQNGAPDGLAVVNTLQPALLDALSYEGEITDANIPPLGVVSLVEGAATPVKDEDFGLISLIRMPSGVDTDDALSDWKLGTPTPGAVNKF